MRHRWPPAARAARSRRRRAQRPEGKLEALAPCEEPRALLGTHVAELRVVDERTARALDCRPDLVAGCGEAGEREARDEERSREEHRLHTRIPAMDAQP